MVTPIVSKVCTVFGVINFYISLPRS